MKRSGFISYSPLIKSLLIPLGIMKFLLILIPVAFLCVLVVVWFNKGAVTALEAVLPMLFSMVIFYFFIVGIILPHQALTVVSSKSLAYLTDFKKFYLLVAFIFSLLFVLMAILAVIYQQQTVRWFEIFKGGVQVWVIASGYVIALFILTYKFPLLQGVIFFTFASIGHIFNFLNQWHPVQLFMVSLVTWLAFSVWWLKLRPQKHHVNFFAQGMEQMMLQGSATNSSGVWLTNFLTPPTKASSFLGTRLMGAPDSPMTIIRMWLVLLVVMLVMAIFLKWLMGDNFKNFMESTGVFFAVFMVISSVSGVLVAICRTIKPVWAFFPGSRTQMFRFIEKYTLTFATKVTLVLPILVLMLNQVAGFVFLNLSQFVWLTLIVVLINFLTFYSVMLVYSRDDDSKMPVSPLHGVIIFVSSILVLILNILLLHQFHTVVASALIFVFLLVVVMRSQLIKKWQYINFVRVS